MPVCIPSSLTGRACLIAIEVTAQPTSYTIIITPSESFELHPQITFLIQNASCSIMTSQFPHRKGALAYGSEAASSQSQEHIKIPSGRLSYSSSSASSSSTSSLSSSPRYALERGQQETTTVEIMRCSRCAKTVEAIGRKSSDGTIRVSSSDACASGMVRFGHNLYYCDRCARLVGYK